MLCACFARFVCTICGWNLLLLYCFLCIFKLCCRMVVYYCLLLQVFIVNDDLLLTRFVIGVVMWFGFGVVWAGVLVGLLLVIWFMSSI